jgi:peptide/nickel transport system permease protein
LSQNGHLAAPAADALSLSEPATPVRAAPPSAFERAIRNWSVRIGGIVVLLMLAIGAAAPILGTLSPTDISPAARNKVPGSERTIRNDDGQPMAIIHRMGTDSLGRDVYSRVLYGARVSIMVGLIVAVLSIAFGLFIGLMSGYFRWLDPVVMRIMDGLMAIPAILLAIALVSLFPTGFLAGSMTGTWLGQFLPSIPRGLDVVVLAITVPEIPRVVRLVRSVVLSVREEPYVEAAVTVGTPTLKLLWRHVLPNTLAPLIVQGTFICASAILIEATLSFLGIGIPPETPTWGNIMAEGRAVAQLFPHNILYPGIFLALTVLAVNMLGDGLRDTLDPKMAKRF